MSDRITEAEAAVATFVAQHAGYTVDREQPQYRGGTNCATFGHFGPQPIVYKHFRSPARWTNELFCLEHWAATGCVPRILTTVPQQMIVMTRLPSGTALGRGNDPALVAAISRQIGQALGQLAGVPLPVPGAGYYPTRDFEIILWGKTPQEALAAYLPRCRAAARSVTPCREPFFRRSLDLLESQMEKVPRHRQVLFHEDMGNLTVDRGRFQGFYDLEMCRLGTEPMQLGVALRLCAEGMLSWADLISGYETETGRRLDHQDHVAILAMHHFYHWIRICRWGWWDGDPADAEQLSAASDYAKDRRAEMQAACRLIDPSLP